MKFQIWKNTKKTKENQPDYRIVDPENNFASIGGGWIRESKKGNKYIGCELKQNRPPVKEEINQGYDEGGEGGHAEDFNNSPF